LLSGPKRLWLDDSRLREFVLFIACPHEKVHHEFFLNEGVSLGKEHDS
jgi:hypothetical protein